MFYTGTFLSTESQHLLIFRVENVKFFKVFVNFFKGFVNFFKAFVNFFKKNVNFFNKQHLSNFLYKTLGWLKPDLRKLKTKLMGIQLSKPVLTPGRARHYHSTKESIF